jgi:hypothetical protein
MHEPQSCSAGNLAAKPRSPGTCAAAIRARSRSYTTMTRPVRFDAEDYKHGIVVERFFNRMKTGAAWRDATTSSPSSFAAA